MNRTSRRAVRLILRTAACVVMVLFATGVAAQPRFEETLEVRLLEIDARVVDREGNPVHGLSASDFVLFEDGRPIDIDSVYEVQTNLIPPAARVPVDEPAVAPPPEARVKPRTIVFFLDQLQLRQKDERAELFRDLTEFVRTALRDGDMTAVFGWAMGGARTIVPLTRDREKIIQTFAGMASEVDSIPSMLLNEKAGLVEFTAAAMAGRGPAGWNFDVEEERRRPMTNCAEEVLAEMRRKTAALKLIVSGLQGDGAAALVYVSNRMPENTGVYCSTLWARSVAAAGPANFTYSTTSLLRDLGKTANAAGVTLYSLRPHVPKTMNDASESESPGVGTAAMRDSVYVANELYSLGVLADVTGGVVGYSPKEIKVALATIESDLDSYYSIAYRATSDGRDRERKIRIETKDKSLTVRARQTLVEKSDLTRAKETLVANLYRVTDTGDFAVAARTTGETTKRNRRMVHTEVRFRPESLTFVEQRNQRVATYRVMIVSSDELGALSEWTEGTRRLVEPEDKRTPVSLEFDLEMMPDGTMTAIGIYDEATGIAGFTVLDTRVAAER